MVKAKKNPTTATGWATEAERIRDILLQNGTVRTELPKEFTKPEDFLKINGTNMLDVDLTGYSLGDLPKQKAFKDAKIDYAGKVHGYLTFMIKNAPTKKRKADVKAEQEQKRLRGARPYDKLLFGDDVEARRAAMKKGIWDDKKKTVTMPLGRFQELGGCRAFWDKLYDEQEAAKVEAARAADKLRRTLRKFRDVKRLDLADFENRTGAPSGSAAYPKYGLSVNETFIQIVEEELGDKLGPLGRSWVCEAWQSETCLELKLRGLMEQLSRILTIGAVTTKEHVDQALAALERELKRALTDKYAPPPPAAAASRVALGEATNHDVASPPAACAVASAADGAHGRSRAAPRFATRAARGDAASALGGNAEPPSTAVLLDVARADNLDLERLVLDRYANSSYGAARFADEPADPTDARPADFLTRCARRASPDLKNKHAIRDAFNELRLDKSPTGRLALVLLDFGLVVFDATTGKAEPGAAIRRMEASYAAEKAGETGGRSKFDIHKVILVAAQYAFINKLLDFERMQLSLFQCVFGRYLLALWAWLNGLTASDLNEMKLELRMLPIEFDEEELALLPDAVAEAFAGGVDFETAADLLEVMQNANEKFAALKNRVFLDAGAAWRDGAADIFERLAAAAGDLKDAMDLDVAAAPPGALDDAASLSAAALRAVALAADAADADLSAPPGKDSGNARKALRIACTAALDSPAPDSVLARVDAALAAGGPSGLAAATRIAADAAPRVGRELFLAVAIYAPPPPEMRFPCEMRFHKPGVGGWTGWRSVADFYAVYEALQAHRSFSSPAWLGASSTLRAFEDSGRQILAGMSLEEFTAPSSVCGVFDYECQGYKYGTYTIFCGSDYQFRVRGRAPVDKCACLVEAVKEYMASRAAA